MHSFGIYLHRFFDWSHFAVTPKWQDELCARSFFTFAVPDSAEVARVWRLLHTRSNTPKQMPWPSSLSHFSSAVIGTGQLHPSLGWQFLSWTRTFPTLTEPEGLLRDTRGPRWGAAKIIVFRDVMAWTLYQTTRQHIQQIGLFINLLKPTGHVMHQQFNPLNTKRRLLYLKTQFVPRSKHFSSRS